MAYRSRLSVVKSAVVTGNVVPSCRREFSWWSSVQPAPRDPILGVTTAYLVDTHPSKINVGVGAYRNDEGKPVVLECVREAEKRIGGRELMEYLPMGGSARFCELAVGLAYGEDTQVLKDKRVASIQALSGTGAVRLFAEFMKRFQLEAEAYLPLPTWSNHHNVFRDANVNQHTYRYYLASTRGLDFEGLKEDLKSAPNRSVILLHACAHNPTGVDPTPEQWKELSKLFKEKEHFPLFDMAYQGFACGDTQRDNQAIRIFLEDGHQLACAQSFAKSMGLYGQRIGCISIVCAEATEAATVKSQLEYIARPMYSSPPVHGSLLVTSILTDSDLKQLWFKEVKEMADRIIGMRVALRKNLEELGSKHSWEHITQQIGMFCYKTVNGGGAQEHMEGAARSSVALDVGAVRDSYGYLTESAWCY
ncbi:hypothetical protein KP509_20G028300 [Ceratopteris richardii]|uniref:Aspartate aminotransferase n=1 Tax=Ceratopteris richardii TaxID=49495 RepID=A0A8T2SH33_CERRI|nr:hypothetical protein KP509_20G028300 [Ceratopteris richardii]